MLLFTDGLSEAEDAEGDQYSEERLVAEFKAQPVKSAQESLNAILQSVDAHCNSRFSDDATAVTLCRI